MWALPDRYTGQVLPEDGVTRILGPVRFGCVIKDLTDDEARRAIVLKWGTVEPDVLPAWVAEMDYALAPPVREALLDAVNDRGDRLSAFEPGGRLGEAYAGFAARHFGQRLDPAPRDRRRSTSPPGCGWRSTC